MDPFTSCPFCSEERVELHRHLPDCPDVPAHLSGSEPRLSNTSDPDEGKDTNRTSPYREVTKR
jgi:hypothetical protein